MSRTLVARGLALSISLAIVFLVSCGDDNGGGPSGPGPFNAIKLDIYNSDALNNGFVFHLWAMSKAQTGLSAEAVAWTSVVTFRTIPTDRDQTATIVTPEGASVASNRFTNLDIDWAEQDSIYITIEPAGSTPSGPEGPVFLRAEVRENLELQSISALAPLFDPNSMSGDFIFATPTDNEPDNDTSGIWFVRPFEPPEKSLNLQNAPSGWKYEGWAWHGGVWLSTGKFVDPGFADESDPYSAADNQPPPFPGEDFLQNNASLPWVFVEGDSVKVTLEPSPDTDIPTPFSTTVLARELPELPIPNILHGFLSADTIQYVPGGNARFQRSDDL